MFYARGAGIVFFLLMGSIQTLPSCSGRSEAFGPVASYWLTPDTQITSCDDRVQPYRPEIKIREKEAAFADYGAPEALATMSLVRPPCCSRAAATFLR
jgi:hypothetical protein